MTSRLDDQDASLVQQMAAALDHAAADDSANEPPDFDVPSDDFGREHQDGQT